MNEREINLLFTETKKSQEEQKLTNELFQLFRKFTTEESKRVNFPNVQVNNNCCVSAIKYLCNTWQHFNFEKYNLDNGYGLRYYKEVTKRGFTRGYNQYKESSKSIKPKNEVRTKLLNEINDAVLGNPIILA